MATTRLQLRQRVRARADMQATSFVSDDEVNTFIQGSYDELYDLLTVTAEDYYTVTVTFSITSGNTYTLPTNFYKLRGLDKADGSNYNQVKPFQFEDRNITAAQFGGPFNGEANARYRIIAGSLFFVPATNAPGDLS